MKNLNVIIAYNELAIANTPFLNIPSRLHIDEEYDSSDSSSTRISGDGDSLTRKRNRKPQTRSIGTCQNFYIYHIICMVHICWLHFVQAI